jgi:hypothetical protein
VIEVRVSYKVLLVLEVLVCFTPMTLLWLTGAVLSPFLLLPYLAESRVEPFFWQGPAMFLGFVGCGLFGLITLFYVLAKLFGKHRPVARPALVLAGAALGVLPILPFALLPDGWEKIWVLMPIASTAHILYLSRRMLFPRSAREGLTT